MLNNSNVTARKIFDFHQSAEHIPPGMMYDAIKAEFPEASHEDIKAAMVMVQSKQVDGQKRVRIV